MIIQPIVEGHGEVAAVPILLRRLVAWANPREAIEVKVPIRKPRNKLVRRDGVIQAINLAQLSEPDAILIMFDGDENCPAELGPQVQQWAERAARDTPCQVVIPHREYEAWFLAAIESLRSMGDIEDDATSPPNPEEPRGAKERIEERMGKHAPYSETIHQPKFSARFSMASAYEKCRSFQKMTSAFVSLLQSAGHEIDPSPSDFRRMEQY